MGKLAKSFKKNNQSFQQQGVKSTPKSNNMKAKFANSAPSKKSNFNKQSPNGFKKNRNQSFQNGKQNFSQTKKSNKFNSMKKDKKRMEESEEDDEEESENDSILDNEAEEMDSDEFDMSEGDNDEDYESDDDAEEKMGKNQKAGVNKFSKKVEESEEDEELDEIDDEEDDLDDNEEDWETEESFNGKSKDKLSSNIKESKVQISGNEKRKKDAEPKNHSKKLKQEEKPKKMDKNSSVVNDQKKKTPSNALENNLPADICEIIEERIKEKNKRTLFVKGFNHKEKIFTDDFAKLHPDITVVHFKRRQKRTYLEFEDEKKCEKAYHQLQNKTIGDNKLIFDFCGEKSNREMPTVPAKPLRPYDPLCLYATGFGKDVETQGLKRLFPTSSSVDVLKFDPKGKGTHKYAFVRYKTPEEARKAFIDSHGKVLGGRSVYVVYALQPDHPIKGDNKKKKAENKKEKKLAEKSEPKAKAKKGVEMSEEDEQEGFDSEDFQSNDDEDESVKKTQIKEKNKFKQAIVPTKAEITKKDSKSKAQVKGPKGDDALPQKKSTTVNTPLKPKKVVEPESDEEEGSDTFDMDDEDDDDIDLDDVDDDDLEEDDDENDDDDDDDDDE